VIDDHTISSLLEIASGIPAKRLLTGKLPDPAASEGLTEWGRPRNLAATDHPPLSVFLLRLPHNPPPVSAATEAASGLDGPRHAPVRQIPAGDIVLAVRKCLVWL